jgi:hypothetical protein
MSRSTELSLPPQLVFPLLGIMTIRMKVKRSHLFITCVFVYAECSYLSSMSSVILPVVIELNVVAPMKGEQHCWKFKAHTDFVSA